MPLHMPVPPPQTNHSILDRHLKPVIVLNVFTLRLLWHQGYFADEYTKQKLDLKEGICYHVVSTAVL